MKRVIFLCILCVTLLCACFAVQEDTNHISGVTGEAVSGGSTEAASIASGAVVSSSVVSVEEKTNPWIITDMNGKKRELKIGDVNTEDVGVAIERHTLAEAHAQVLDGHYYYVRKEGKCRYTLYRDRGNKVGSFGIEKDDEFAGCTVYNNQFYVLLYSDECEYNEGELFYQLAVADFSSGKLLKRGMIPGKNVCVYQNQIYRYMHYGQSGTVMEIMDISGDTLRKIPFPDDEINTVTGIVDGKLYYTVKREKEVAFLRLDLETGEAEEVFKFEPNVKISSKKSLEVWIYMDKEGIFFEEIVEDDIKLYMIPWSGKKMVKDTRIKAQNYSFNSQYEFYIDTSSRIHRWNRKKQKEDRIIETKIHPQSWLNCTEDGLYIQECAYEAHNLYFLDSDGKKPIKIWDDKNYVKEEWDIEYEGEDGDDAYW